MGMTAGHQSGTKYGTDAVSRFIQRQTTAACVIFIDPVDIFQLRSQQITMPVAMEFVMRKAHGQTVSRYICQATASDLRGSTQLGRAK